MEKQTIFFIALVSISVINLFCIIAIGAFLVRFRDRTNNIFSDLIQAMEVMWGAIPLTPTVEPVTESNRPKTWDEKYEEELEAMSRRLQSDSGLKDLPNPSLSWGSPPAPNVQNTEGLTIKDR